MVHLMNVEEGQVAANTKTGPINLGHDAIL